MDLSDVFGGVFSLFLYLGLLIIGLAWPVGIIVAFFSLLKKTKEEEAALKLEIQRLVGSLPPESRAAFIVQYNAQRKNPTTAVLLALFLGGLGIHKFYLEKIGQGILYLLFCWTYIPTIVGFFEAFTITRTVLRMNRDVAREAAAMLGGDIAALARMP